MEDANKVRHSEVVQRAPMKFGSTLIFQDAFATQLIAFQIVEDDYAPNDEGTLERDPPYAVLYFAGGAVIELEGEDFEAFKLWYEKASRPIERPALVQP